MTRAAATTTPSIVSAIRLKGSASSFVVNLVSPEMVVRYLLGADQVLGEPVGRRSHGKVACMEHAEHLICRSCAIQLCELTRYCLVDLERWVYGRRGIYEWISFRDD